MGSNNPDLDDNDIQFKNIRRRKKAGVLFCSGIVACFSTLTGLLLSSTESSDFTQPIVLNTFFSDCFNFITEDGFENEGLVCDFCEEVAQACLHFSGCNNTCEEWELSFADKTFLPKPDSCAPIEVPELEHEKVCPEGFYIAKAETTCSPNDTPRDIAIFQDRCYLCTSPLGGHTFDDCLNVCETENCGGIVANPADPDDCFAVPTNLLGTCDVPSPDATFCRKIQPQHLCFDKLVKYSEAEQRCANLRGKLISSSNDIEFLRLQEACLNSRKVDPSIGCWADTDDDSKCFYLSGDVADNLLVSSCSARRHFCCEFFTNAPTIPEDETLSPTTPDPTIAPSESPTTSQPSVSPTTSQPTLNPTTSAPTLNPTLNPTTSEPTLNPTQEPTLNPTSTPTTSPTTSSPTLSPTTDSPTESPTTAEPTSSPTTIAPTSNPTTPQPTKNPTANPTTRTDFPTESPTTSEPTVSPTTSQPTVSPSKNPTANPTTSEPTLSPTTSEPTLSPTTEAPTNFPTASPTTSEPTKNPTSNPTSNPTLNPTESPTRAPSFVTGPPGSNCADVSPGAKDVVPVDIDEQNIAILDCQEAGNSCGCLLGVFTLPIAPGSVIPITGEGLPLSFNQFAPGEPTVGAGQSLSCTIMDPTQGFLWTSIACDRPCSNGVTPVPLCRLVTNAPTSSPTLPPTDPTESPTTSPTRLPTTSPTKNPTTSPTKGPTEYPTGFPTTTPTENPTALPTVSPTKAPTGSPTRNPSSSPTANPTESPTRSPTDSPTKGPTESPTRHPTASPTANPTESPTTAPTGNPTVAPSTNPTEGPTRSPSTSPSSSPTTSQPTESPTKLPTSAPSQSPSVSPTTPEPTSSPSLKPTQSPSAGPTQEPTQLPTGNPTTTPSISPTRNPTVITDFPTRAPTFNPTKFPVEPVPTERPTFSPTFNPTTFPTISPTSAPTKNPTRGPTLFPTNNPTSSPTNGPTESPTDNPTEQPTVNPTKNPSASPSINPTENPTLSPTRSPSKNPTRNPTIGPTTSPTQNPTTNPSNSPTKRPTQNPTKHPTLSPSISPTENPTANPTKGPTTSPTFNPTFNPTSSPSTSPTNNPTKNPTTFPTTNPTLSPTNSPSESPTENPTKNPTANPTNNPTLSPSFNPTENPTVSPTQNPSASPTRNPSTGPTTTPTRSPSTFPTKNPTTGPTNAPSRNPTTGPTENPTLSPSQNPTVNPTVSPTLGPSSSPTQNPTTSAPTQNPTVNPTVSPSKSPTFNPTIFPTHSPTFTPTTFPTKDPTSSPTKFPTRSPTTNPTKLPTAKPTASPENAPTPNPTNFPTRSPTFNPTTFPTSPPPTPFPTEFPTESPVPDPTASPTNFPTSFPTDGPPTPFPTVLPTSFPVEGLPTTFPSIAPTFHPTTFPTELPTVSPTSFPTSDPHVSGVCRFKNGESVWSVRNDDEAVFDFHSSYLQNGHATYAYDVSDYPYCTTGSSQCPLKNHNLNPGDRIYIVAPAGAIEYFLLDRHCEGHAAQKSNFECLREQGIALVPDEPCKCIDHRVYFDSFDYIVGECGREFFKTWERYYGSVGFIRAGYSFTFPGEPDDPTICASPGGKCLDLIGNMKTDFEYVSHLEKHEQLESLAAFIDYHCTVHFKAAGSRRCGTNSFNNEEDAKAAGCLEYFNNLINLDNTIQIKFSRTNDDVLSVFTFFDIPAMQPYKDYSATADVYDSDKQAYISLFSEGQHFTRFFAGPKEPVGNFFDDIDIVCCCVELFDHYIFDAVFHSQGPTGSGQNVPFEKSDVKAVLNKPPNDEMNTGYGYVDESDDNSTDTSDSVTPQQTYALGLGGSAVFKFDSGFYMSLVIFENSILDCNQTLNGLECDTSKADANEDVIVEVSVDGVNFVVVAPSVNALDAWEIYDVINDVMHGTEDANTGFDIEQDLIDLSAEDINEAVFHKNLGVATPEGDKAVENAQDYFTNNHRYQSFLQGSVAQNSSNFQVHAIRFVKIQLPSNLACYKYVRLTDTSVGTKDVDDGFDLHAIKTTHVCCTEANNDAFFAEQQVIADEEYFENFAVATLVRENSPNDASIVALVIGGCSATVFILTLFLMGTEQDDKRDLVSVPTRSKYDLDADPEVKLPPFIEDNMMKPISRRGIDISSLDNIRDELEAEKPMARRAVNLSDSMNF